eukprot:1010354-Prorocentrum_minimum.AAC.1
MARHGQCRILLAVKTLSSRLTTREFGSRLTDSLRTPLLFASSPGPRRCGGTGAHDRSDGGGASRGGASRADRVVADRVFADGDPQRPPPCAGGQSRQSERAVGGTGASGDGEGADAGG